MKFKLADGTTFDMPDPKAELTQELLGGVYDDLDEALDYLECVYQATQAADHKYATTAPLRAVLSIAQAKVTAAKDKLHDTIAWVA